MSSAWSSLSTGKYTDTQVKGNISVRRHSVTGVSTARCLEHTVTLRSDSNAVIA